MVYELSIQTTKPGRAADAAKLGEAAVARRLGALAGCWTTEIGPLNQALTLRRYASRDEQARLRVELGADATFRVAAEPHRELLIREELKLMRAVVEPVAPERPGIYEIRTYRIRPGGQTQWLELFTGALPARERHSKLVALFATETGQPDEVCHFWVYPDLVDRSRARDAAAADPDWRAFLAASRELQLVQEMTNAILLPVPHSPLQ